MAFDPLDLRPAYTEHLGQLTCTALSPPLSGMKGVDLGVSFPCEDRVVFLFGDTMASDRRMQDADWSATAPLARPASGLPPLAWLARLAPPGLPLGRMGVPVDGLSIDRDTLVFFATRFDEATRTYGTSALARTKGLALDRLAIVHEAPAGDFANVSVVVHGDTAFVYGTGDYRRSAVRLARVPVHGIGDRAAWRVEPRPVIDVACAGELSARKHPTLPLWMIAFQGDAPRGVSLWLAADPAGPWRPAGTIFAVEDGYERFIHAKESDVGHDDGVAQPGDEETWGDAYGPYLVPSYFGEEDGAFSVIYTLSSWNPYQVHLVRTWLVPPGTTRKRPIRGADLAPPKIASDGTFTVDAATRALSFSLHGRRGSARLWRGRDVVRSSRAPGMFRTRTVRWNLEAYAGEELRLEIDRADARGFAFQRRSAVITP